MSVMSAQVSLYPLRQVSIGPPIRETVRIFRERGLKTRVGEMSTLVWGSTHFLTQRRRGAEILKRRFSI